MANTIFTYQELENQIVELKKENDILKFHSSIQEKEDSEFFYNSILNNIGDPVFVKDEQSRLLLVNDAFTEIFNLPRNSIIGKTLAEDVLPDERDLFLKIDRQVIADGIENINEEALTVRGGETRTICTRKMRFIDSHGKKYLVGVIHDITELKKSEDSLKESEKQLKELNATKDKLFTIIGHDLRSPFHNIIGFSELLIQNITNFEESEKFIRILHSSAKNTLVLLDNLLSWAKSQTGQLSFTPVNITFSSILEEIITHTKSFADTKGISIKYSITNDLEVYADVNMLKTVLRNLFSNAIKFTKLGGHIQVFAILKHDHVEISISDDGIGIDPEKMKALFKIGSNVFTLGTAKEKGSGFGLILCKEFINKHKGEIWVESEKGKGSNFKFTLPLNTSNFQQ